MKTAMVALAAAIFRVFFSIGTYGAEPACSRHHYHGSSRGHDCSYPGATRDNNCLHPLNAQLESSEKLRT